MRWPFVSRTRYASLEAAYFEARADLAGAQTTLDAVESCAARAESLLASAEALIGVLMRGPAAARDLSAVRAAITEADPNVPTEPTALEAVTPAVLDACRQFAYGDRRQESANRAHVYRLARQGADEATILRALRLGDREGVA